MEENRIYIDGKLVNICYNEYTLFCNYDTYVQKFGKKRVSLKRLKETTNDEEKQEWLKSLK